MPLSIEYFRIRNPETDLYWTLHHPHPERLPADAAWPIALRSGVDNALALSFRDGMLLHRDSNRQAVFPGQLRRRARGLALAPLPAETSTIIEGPWTMDYGDKSRATLKIWDVYLSPTNDDRELTVSASEYDWEIERLHSNRFETVKNAFLDTGELARQDLDGLCRLDVETLFELALTTSNTSVDGANAVVELIEVLPDPGFVACALNIFCEHRYRSEAYRILNLVACNQELASVAIVEAAALPVLIQFFRGDDNERIRAFASRLLKTLGSDNSLLSLLRQTIRCGNLDFYRLCVREGIVHLDKADMIELLTLASGSYLAALGTSDDESIATRKQILLNVAFDCCPTVVAPTSSSQGMFCFQTFVLTSIQWIALRFTIRSIISGEFYRPFCRRLPS
jgi:hypothetical protein